MFTISKLHFITTTADAAAKACAGGVNWIQLRLKNVDGVTYLNVAREVRDVCTQYGATFIVNDNVDVAMASYADGVHLGKEDMSPVQARRIMGEKKIIGCTANTLEDISRLSDLDINYIGLGPYRHTTTKINLSPILGFHGYQRIFKKMEEDAVYAPPIVGIGGITTDDVSPIISAGCHGIAVSGGIGNASDITAAAKSYLLAMQEVKDIDCCI